MTAKTALTRRSVLGTMAIGGMATGLTAHGANAAASTGPSTIYLADYATQDQLAGRANASAVFQAAVDDLPNGGTLVAPSDARLWFDGSKWVSLAGKHDIVIELNGCTIFRTSKAGTYVIFLVRGIGTGYGASGRNITIQNGRFEGSFKDTAEANLCCFGSNHGQNITIRNCEFVACNHQSGHIMDLGGCDNVVIEDCVFRGFKPIAGHIPRSEAVNIDVSVANTGADLPPYLDGLACRNIFLRRCQFVPYTDPDTGISYPSPNPMGSHLAREGQPFENIHATDITVVGPVVDPADTGLGDNAEVRGLFHVPGVKGLWITARIIADGQGSCRVVQAQSASHGSRASTDPNDSTAGQGSFTVPNPAEDIHIDIEVTGMKGEVSDLNPTVFVGGVDGGTASNIEVKATVHGAKEVVYLYKAENASVSLGSCVDAQSGVRAEQSDWVRVTGDFQNVQVPVRFHSGTTHASLGPATVLTATPRDSVIECEGGADYIDAKGVTAIGYTKMFSQVPAHRTEKSNILL